MKFEIYGLSLRDLDGSWYSEDGEWLKRGTFLGTYDGIEFTSDKFELGDLEKYQYLHIFAGDRLLSHNPQKYNKDIETRLKERYIAAFGEIVQTSLF